MASSNGEDVDPNSMPIASEVSIITEEQFNRTHSACNDESLYHDLKCSHRVKTRYYEGCGTNCNQQGDSTPFICPVCVTGKVRLEIQLEGLALMTSVFETSNGQDEKIKVIAQKEIDTLTRKHHRLTVVVPKLEPKLQFFSEIPGAQENGGFLKDTTGNEPERKYKRPGKSARLHFRKGWAPSRAEKPRESGLARARPANSQNLRFGGRPKIIDGKQFIVPNRTRGSYPQMHTERMFGSGPSGVVVGDLNMSQLQPGVSKQAGSKYSKPRPAQFAPKDLVVQPTKAAVPNLPEDAASRAVRQVLEALSLKDK